MKHPLLAATAIAAALHAGLVQGQEINVGAGGTAGEYTNTVVPAIDAGLQAVSGYSATPVVSAGSRENLQRLLAGELDFALVQLDVLALNKSEQVELVDLIAPEAVLCAARTDGRVLSYYNLTDQRADPLVISVGPEGSGSAATMEFLLALDPDFDADQLAFIYSNNTEAELDRLAAGTRDVVCFVMLANPSNPLIKKVAESDQLKFIDFISAYALEATVADINVYESSVVPVSDGMWGFRAAKVQTLTTWMALVARADASPEQVAAMRDVTANPDLLPATTSAGKAKRLFGDWKDKAQEWGSKAKDKALVLKEKAKQKATTLKEKASDLTTKAIEKAGELKDKATNQ